MAKQHTHQNNEWCFETQAIHSGFGPDSESGASKSPIYQSTAFCAESAEDLENIFKGQSYGFYYSRVSNPTVANLESRVNVLHRGIGTVAVASGMAAITAMIFALASAGDHIIVSKSLFGSTYYLIEGLIKNSGISATFVNPTNLSEYVEAISEKTRLIFVEALGNPKLDIPDIKSVSALAMSARIPLVVDNTFVSPYLLDARSLGAHVVINATTKYLCGGNSAVGGTITDLGQFDWRQHRGIPVVEMEKFGQNAFVAAVKKVRSNSGAALSPQNAFLTLAGIETLAIRMNQHAKSAQSIAQYLAAHPKVNDVVYPGLKTHPQYDLGKRQFPNGCGGMMTIRMGNKDNAYRLIDAFKLIDNSVNLGDSRTLAICPAETIYRHLTPEARESAGVYDDLIRLSIGLEHITDILGDFDQALECV
jgi:O-acetylhomoserine (thiol)-lyase